jgi:glycosyltransferase involved in cell wall biosynthesis
MVLDGAEAMSETGMDTTRVLFTCTGVGIFNRGIETFFREAFDGLQGIVNCETHLLNGRGVTSERERSAWCLPRTGAVAPLIGRGTGRSAYAVEQWTSLFSVVQEIRRFRPHLVFTSEANLMFLLRRFRRQIGVPFRVLFSNGGPCHPPFDRHDFVHQVAPFYREEALSAGEPEGKHLLVPYGIHVPTTTFPDAEERKALRQRLGLPVDRPVVLSVGWIARQHKRMDYIINEVAALPGPRPFLQLLGAMDQGSDELIALGRERLGPSNFAAASVAPEAVADYYRAADLFVLGSLAEGFGRVYLESLAHGLPTIGHRHPVVEYVLGDMGIVGDLEGEGGLTPILARELTRLPSANPEEAVARRESVRDRFSWEALRPAYSEMFATAATVPMPWVTG